MCPRRKMKILNVKVNLVALRVYFTDVYVQILFESSIFIFMKVKLLKLAFKFYILVMFSVYLYFLISWIQCQIIIRDTAFEIRLSSRQMPSLLPRQLNNDDDDDDDDDVFHTNFKLDFMKQTIYCIIHIFL